MGSEASPGLLDAVFSSSVEAGPSILCGLDVSLKLGKLSGQCFSHFAATCFAVVAGYFIAKRPHGRLPSCRNTGSPALKALSLAWERATHEQRRARDPCIYKGLGQVLSNEVRNAVVGVRIASLALMSITSGLPETVMPDMVNWIDTFWPGEMGEINHSAAFTRKFRKSAVKVLRRFQRWDLESRLPALQVQSDICLISDGISTHTGIPLHCHIVVQEGRGGGIQYNLVGIQPTTSIAGDPGFAGPASSLSFSTRESLLKHSDLVLDQFGLGFAERKLRWAGRVGDGLEEGPNGAQMGCAQAKVLQLHPPDLYGNLDAWHSVETAASHADALSSSLGIEYREQYLAVAKRLRSRFFFGAHAALPRVTWLVVGFMLCSFGMTS